MPSYDVGYYIADAFADQVDWREGESDWADTLEEAIALGRRADCDFFIVFTTKLVPTSWGQGEQRTGIAHCEWKANNNG